MRAVQFNQLARRLGVPLAGAVILPVALGVILLLALLAQTSTLASEASADRFIGSAQVRPPEGGAAEWQGIPEIDQYGVITTAVSGGLAYVTLANSDRVALVDTASHFVGMVNVGAAGCHYPWRAALTPDGKRVYVSCQNSGNLAVIATASNTVAGTVEGTTGADGIAFTRDGAYALVGSNSSNRLTVVDLASGFVSYKSTPGPTRGTAAHPYLDRAYAACGDGSVLVLDTKTFATVKRIPVGGDPGDVALSADGQWLYASDRQGGGLTVIDAGSNAVHTRVTGLGNLAGLEVAPDGSAVYASGLSNGVHVIDGTTFERIATITGVGDASEVAVTCDSRELYVGSGGDEVPVIDTETRAVVDRIGVPGSGAQGIAICPPRVAKGVLLAPGAQSRSAGRGQVVTYQQRLVNASGATDSFSLTLGSHGWETALSTTTVGPIANGEVMTFTLYVTVPVGAEWYASDTAVVTATSLSSPAAYSDAARFTTRAYARPQLTVSPAALTSTQYMNQVVTRPLSIGNGNGVTLTFNITQVDLEGLVLWNKLGSDDEVLNSEVGENGAIVGTSYAYEPAMFGNGYVKKAYWQNYVRFPASILDRLTQRGAVELWVNPKVPQPVPYQYGVFGLLGSYYGHGGEPTNWNIGLFWGDTVTFRGLVGGIRFDGSLARTPDEPNQFVAAPMVPFHAAISWDIAGIDGMADKVRVYRNGAVVGSTTSSWNPYGTQRGDIILNTTADSGGADKFIVDNVKIWSYAKTDFSDRFGEAPPYTPWLSTDPVSGAVLANNSMPVQVTFDATGLLPGSYDGKFVIRSNDPARPLTSVPVTMTVEPAANIGWVEGRVVDAWTGTPLTATVIAVGQPYTITTKADGAYKLWLDAGSHTLQASATGYVTQTIAVSVTAQQGLAQDFALELNVPRLRLSPESLAVTHYAGEVTTRPLTVTNAGPAPLTFSVASAWKPGDGALQFDGINDQLSMGPSNGLMLTDSDFTVEAWISTTQTTVGRILGKHEPGWWNGYFLEINGEYAGSPFPNKVWFYTADGPGEVAVSTTDINDGRWHHIAGVYHRSGAKELFVDGILEATMPDSIHLSPTDDPFRVGFQAEGWPDYLQGWVDEVRVWNVARTQAEIQGAMNARLVGDESGLVGYWRLDEGSGQVAHDSTSNQNDGQLGSTPGPDTNDPTWVMAIHPGTEWPSWLTVSPSTGAISGHSSLPVVLSFDATGVQPEKYTAELSIASNDPFTPSVSIPVTMTVLPTANMGWVEGHVTDARRGVPLAATILAVGQPYSVTSAVETGAYRLWLDAGSRTLQVAAPGYITATVQANVVAQQGVTRDIGLRRSGELFLPLIYRSGAASALIWNLDADFRRWPNQENPNRDSYGNPGVWHFMSANLNRQAHALLPSFRSNAENVPGLQQWYEWQGSTQQYLPEVTINATGAEQRSGSVVWPPNAVKVHPFASELAVVGWRSPVAGTVSVSGSVTHINSCGDGIAWYIDKNGANLASGSIAPGGAQDFRGGSGGSRLSSISVNRGDMLYFAIHPGSDYYCDWTRLDISIQLLP